jgi:hypothetical protein
VRAIAMARFPFFPLAFRFLAPSFALSFRAYLSFFSGHFQKCLTQLLSNLFLQQIRSQRQMKNAPKSGGNSAIGIESRHFF